MSKRVNIQRLKADIWGNIRATLPNVDPTAITSTAQENAPASTAPTLNKTSSATAEGGMSFQTMIADLAAGDEVRQRDVTLPFYFICLLHLANEHVSSVMNNVLCCETWVAPRSNTWVALCLVMMRTTSRMLIFLFFIHTSYTEPED